MVQTAFQNSFLLVWAQTVRVGRNLSDPLPVWYPLCQNGAVSLSPSGWIPPVASKLTISFTQQILSDFTTCVSLVLGTKPTDVNKTDKSPALMELTVS